MSQADASDFAQDGPDLPAWEAAATLACANPRQAAVCPACNATALGAQWAIDDLYSRKARVDLACAACGKSRQVKIDLPINAPDAYPFSRLADVGAKLVQQSIAALQAVQNHAKLLPAAVWTTDPNWLLAGWEATTFRWHPTSESPPVMGLVFANAEPARKLFESWNKKFNHGDELEEIRVSIVEGEIPGHASGYTVHIGPDPDNSLVRATAAGVVLPRLPLKLLGHVRRMHPMADVPAMLPSFKREYGRHREFLLAPALKREDGKTYFEVDQGIIKRSLLLRRVGQIDAGDVDAVVLRRSIIEPGDFAPIR